MKEDIISIPYQAPEIEVSEIQIKGVVYQSYTGDNQQYNYGDSSGWH